MKPIVLGASLLAALASYGAYLHSMTLADEYDFSFAGGADGALLLFSFAISVIAFLIMLNISHHGKPGKGFWVAMTMSILLTMTSFFILAFAYVTMYSFESRNSEKIELIKVLEASKNMSSIDLESLKELEEDNYTGMVLVKREGCIFCATEVPALHDYLKRRQLGILFYDTAVDRMNKKEKVDEVMEQYDIELVPTLIIMNDGEVVQKLVGQDIVDQLEEYLSVRDV